METTHRPGCDLQQPEPRQLEHGMTLVEVLVVLAVFGLIIGVAYVNLGAMYQKYRLDQGSSNFKSFYEAVPGIARTQNRDIFVTWNGGSRTLAASTDQAGTQVLEQIQIPDYLVVNPAPSAMRCDTTGRAYVGAATNMMGAVATTTITHQKMVDGYLTPRITYRISLTPLWHVRMQREVQ